MIPATPAETDAEDVRRIEPDNAWIDDDRDGYGLSEWADEHGYDFTPGNWPSPIAGI